jgi:hypothetical protein
MNDVVDGLLVHCVDSYTRVTTTANTIITTIITTKTTTQTTEDMEVLIAYCKC